MNGIHEEPRLAEQRRLQDNFGSSEGALGIDHPPARAQGREPVGESLRVRQTGVLAEELEFGRYDGRSGALRGSGAETGVTAPAPRGRIPACRILIEGKAAAGHDAVHVRMVSQ